MSAPEDRKPARALLVLAGALAVVGSCGVTNGIRGLGTVRQPAASEVDAADGRVAETSASSAAKLHEVVWDAPLRRPLAAANIVVSVMLVAGAVLLAQRRAAAVWWVTQTAVANALWTASEVARELTRLVGASDELAAVLGRELEARLAARDATDVLPADAAGVYMLWLYGAVFAISGLVRIAFYVWVGIRTRRPDVQALLEADVQHGPR